MGLLSKTLGIANILKDKLSQGIQGAVQGLNTAKDFVYNNRHAIGGALNAAAPFISSINPALGAAASKGGSFLQQLKPGPVKDKLTKIVDDSTPTTKPTTTIGNPVVQYLVEQRRALSRAATSKTPATRKRKRKKTRTKK